MGGKKRVFFLCFSSYKEIRKVLVVCVLCKRDWVGTRFLYHSYIEKRWRVCTGRPKSLINKTLLPTNPLPFSLSATMKFFFKNYISRTPHPPKKSRRFFFSLVI